METKQIQYVGGKSIQLADRLSDGRSVFYAFNDNGERITYTVSLEDYNKLFSTASNGFIDVTPTAETTVADSIAEPLDEAVDSGKKRSLKNSKQHLDIEENTDNNKEENFVHVD